jgi:hypothetical protein
LQFISGREYFSPPFRLVVIISAWDRVTKTKLLPSKWLFDTFPLLGQYLDSNKDAFELAVYGVSAQGCDYRQVADVIDQVPSERIQVIGVDIKNPHDLTEPLLWLMR